MGGTVAAQIIIDVSRFFCLDILSLTYYPLPNNYSAAKSEVRRPVLLGCLLDTPTLPQSITIRGASEISWLRLLHVMCCEECIATG